MLALGCTYAPVAAQQYNGGVENLLIPAREFAPEATSLSTLLIEDLSAPSLPAGSDELVQITVQHMMKQLLPEGVRAIGTYTYRLDGKAMVEAQVIVFQNRAQAARRWNNHLGEPTAPQNLRAVRGANYPAFETTTEMTKRYMLVGNVWVSAKEMDANSPLDHLHVLKRYVDAVERGAAKTAGPRQPPKS